MGKTNQLIAKNLNVTIGASLTEVLSTAYKGADMFNSLLKRAEAITIIARTKDANGVNLQFETVVDPDGLGNADSYAVTNQDSVISLNDTIKGVGQSFTGDGGKLDYVQFYLKKTGAPSGFIYAKIYTISGTHGTDATPNNLLITSEPINVSDLSTSFALYKFSFNNIPIFLNNGTNYIVTIEYIGGDASNSIDVGIDASTPTHAGNASTYNGASWTADNTKDAIFYVARKGVFDWVPLAGYQTSDAQMQLGGTSTLNLTLNYQLLHFRVRAIRGGTVDGLLDIALYARLST